MLKFFDEDDLIDRLVHANKEKAKPVVFIVGSPLTAPHSELAGVLNVDQIVNLIRSEFDRDHKILAKLDEALSSTTQYPYQSAFEFLIGRRGPVFANQIIRKAVLSARKEKKDHSSDDLRNEHFLQKIENDLGGWDVSKAVSSLGGICVSCKDVFGKAVLTTNFDPLIEIAIKNRQGDVFSSMTHGDGNIAQSTGAGVQVVHLHGYWRGSDTLHTPAQLTQPRLQLKNSLTTLIRNSLVVVVAYGGWDDVITEAIAEAITDDSSYPEIIWTFFSKSDQDIEAKNVELIRKLGPGIARGRANFYKGIDCHSFFPLLHEALTAGNEGEAEVAVIQPEERETEADVLTHSVLSRAISSIDAFPKNEFWVGREAEIYTLGQTQAKVISISGMGGEGKSALASAFMQEFRKSANDDVVVDWRDCREQSNTIHLALSGAAARVLMGVINAEELSKLPGRDIIELFSKQLAKTSGVFVFDNVDNYVDLETSQPLGQLKDLIEAVLATDTASKLIFTSRPRIAIENSSFQELQLKGISHQASKELFEKKSLRKIDANEVNDLYALTQGHPLWIGIIAAQCAATGKAPLVQFSEIRSGRGDLPERAMRATWVALTNKAQHLLRVLAELERPADPSNIEDLVDMRWNQLTKALSNLRRMSLIVQKEQEDGKELIDLHPLIRQFVRKEFPKKDRESFINIVLTFVDRRLTRFGALTGATIPFEVLDNWVHKVELLINQQNYDGAVETLVNIESQLQKKGLHAEIVRLGKKIFQEINWIVAIQSTGKFEAFVSATIHSIVAIDSLDEAERWAAKYEDSISGKGLHYISLCEIRAYINWFSKNYEDAIHWAKLGVTLRKDYDVTSHHDCAHTLALAQRDSGDAAGALDYFLGGATVEECISGAEIGQKNGPYYGNIGRCLQLLGDSDKALKAYQLCASYFEKDGGDALNQGYLRFWVGEVMEALGRVEDALFFYLIAINKWQKVTPLKVVDIQARVDELLSSHPDLADMIDTPQWKAENRFVEWSKRKSSAF